MTNSQPFINQTFKTFAGFSFLNVKVSCFFFSYHVNVICFGLLVVQNKQYEDVTLETVIPLIC